MGEAIKKGQKVKMEATQQEQMSYEELSKVAGEMQMQGQRLYEENIQLRQALGDQEKYARMSFLFEVIKYKDTFNKETVKKAAKELANTLYPKEEKDSSEQVESKEG